MSLHLLLIEYVIVYPPSTSKVRTFYEIGPFQLVLKTSKEEQETSLRVRLELSLG